MSNTKRICVIGAGAAGLCAARHASAKHLVPMVFEQSEVLGGTVSWFKLKHFFFFEKIHSILRNNFLMFYLSGYTLKPLEVTQKLVCPYIQACIKV